jgi:hypothetical protein
MSAIEYEERYVVFLDILGFKELVHKSEANPEILKKLTAALSAMNIFKGLDELLEKSNPSIEISYKRMVKISTFSDSVIISTRADTIGLLLITSIAQIISCNLFYLGILSRGAISKGLLIHTDNMVLGGGLIKAYELESKAAIYPRIIVDECVLNDIANNEKYNSWGASIISDFDGMYYINFLTLAPLLIASQLYGQNTKLDLLGNARAGLEELWGVAKDLGVKAKIAWMVNYINSKAASLGVARIEIGVTTKS